MQNRVQSKLYITLIIGGFGIFGSDTNFSDYAVIRVPAHAALPGGCIQTISSIVPLIRTIPSDKFHN